MSGYRSKIAERRTAFIRERLAAGGLNRADLIKEYEFSIPTAVAVIRNFRTTHPDEIEYDPSQKLYRSPTRPIDPALFE